MTTNATKSERSIENGDPLTDAETYLEAIEGEHVLVDMALAKIAAAHDDSVDRDAKLRSACCYLGSVLAPSSDDARRVNEAAQLLVCALEVEQA